MFVRLLFLFTMLSCASVQAFQSINLDQVFATASKTYGVPVAVLKSICELESKGNPWALNINGIGFQPDTKQQAMALLRNTQDRPWALTLHYKGEAPKTSFFRTKSDARKALNDIYSNNRRWYLPNPTNVVLRKLDIRSTDVGLMQINYLFHGRHFNSKEDLFDPVVNIHYAARYLRKLMSRHGTLKQAVAHYHSNTQKYQTIYLSLFWPIYQQYLSPEA